MQSCSSSESPPNRSQHIPTPVLTATSQSRSRHGSRAFSCTPEEIRPFARRSPRKKDMKQRKKGKSQILTDTPIKAAIELQSRSEKHRGKARKRLIQHPPAPSQPPVSAGTPSRTSSGSKKQHGKAKKASSQRRPAKPLKVPTSPTKRPLLPRKPLWLLKKRGW